MDDKIHKYCLLFNLMRHELKLSSSCKHFQIKKKKKNHFEAIKQ